MHFDPRDYDSRDDERWEPMRGKDEDGARTLGRGPSSDRQSSDGYAADRRDDTRWPERERDGRSRARANGVIQRRFLVVRCTRLHAEFRQGFLLVTAGPRFVTAHRFVLPCERRLEIGAGLSSGKRIVSPVASTDRDSRAVRS